ncbi:MAG: tripartite tricarboxylate transporter substrate binding protein [Synergistaceae bacterium]|nr:tripartite tricarboxylate transporter substrate binding protein [Synergistaceae bacterium]MBQ9628229.1 tripartite tricarboxylate transporter substrate binding protein [Synergistaceae bacterium]MBR0070363.1 tripartite tricarboxylate transporter substrate binding protein [Synergistaceae bacterium]MBR0250092.1 tripartite tricarboxylate transporter substrate binding protein [Synergistaceae bacterium]
MKKLFSVVMFLVLVLSASSAMAAYPEKSLTAICPWGAGGGTDSCLRAFCQALEKQLGQTIVVDNRTGAGGVTGHEAIADADPDGYTFGMITFEFVTYKALDVSDYKSYVNYDPLCRLNADPAGITVNKAWAEKNGIATLKDFIEYCKKHPGEVRMGGSSANSVWHIAGGYFMNVAGVELKMVTYPDGAASAVQAAAQGVDIEGVTVSLAEARSFIESGNLICLGLMAEERINNAVFGNIPTCKEQGVNAFYATWRGLGLPNGVDPAIRTKLADACAAAVKDEDFVKYMNNAGLGIAYMNAAEFKAFLEQQEEKDVPAAMEAAGIEI